jgi:hypothetical protein
MKTASHIVLVIFLLALSAHRLPAPFSETPEATPTPKPKREATQKSKPKPEPTSKRTATPNRSFAGTWSGSTVDTSSNGNQGSSNYVVKISDDEKTVLISWRKAEATTNGPDYPAACIRFGSALSWSLKQMGETPIWQCTDTLQLNSNGTASYASSGSIIAGDYEGGTFNSTGTFSRQGASSTPAVMQTGTTVPATTPTTPVPKSVGGVPVAKPVPNKPGFVYNPFDPNSKVLLDVRGKGSGTKVKDPFSGKLFVVP